MHPTYELVVLLGGLVVASVITAAIVLKILPAWWRRQDRLAEQRYTRRPR